MALITSSLTPAEAYPVIKRNAAALKHGVLAVAAKVTAGGAGYEVLRGGLEMLVRSKAQLEGLRLVPGLDEHAALQEDNPAYVVVAEIDTVIAEIDAIINWGSSAVPVSVDLKPVSEWAGAEDMISSVLADDRKAELEIMITSLLNTLD